MILNVIFWYLIVALVGWLTVPLAYRMLGRLPDRGLTLARPLGLLLWGYIYWILVSLHILQNDSGGVLSALLIAAVLSGWQLRKIGFRTLVDWLRSQRRLILTSELVFLGLFVFMALVRAANPDATGTEKPMELAFINAILRSPSFPPSDPWLSGYAISYYYFGYVMVAMLARIAAVPGSVAFNLALATWFALSGLSAYAIVYNLLASRDQHAERLPSTAAPLLAPLFLLLVSNLQGFLEMLHARGLFWQQTASGWTSGFWRWLDIQEVTNPPALPLGWQPERPGGIWWWRASRVLQDYDWNVQSREIIDEFPAFSYLLGDLHPHLLAMPFVLLAVGLALNTYIQRRSGEFISLENWSWLRRPDFWLAALVLGGLSFLNTWDFPIYLALFAAAAVLPGFLRSRFRWSVGTEFGVLLLSLGAAGILLYLPFYIGFASQASGIMPSLIFFTRGTHFWVMFAPLLLPVFAWLIWKIRRADRPGASLLPGLLFAAGLVGGLLLLSMVAGWLILSREPGLAGIFGAAPGAPLVLESLMRRLASPGAWLTLLALVALAWALLARAQDRAAASEDSEPAADSRVVVPQPSDYAPAFVLLLILLGAGLTLFPEFFYLRDQFGWRMNTIFKFYYQAWVVWACAAAYASAVLWSSIKSALPSIAFRAVWIFVVVIALVYPFFGFLDRTNGFQPNRWTLDGSAYLATFEPDEMAAVRWLQNAPYGVLAEATSPGASYTGFSRVSTLTGLPGVLGWPGHESQWRGGAVEMGSREPDLQQLYQSRTWDQVLPILEKYNIRYVFVGGLERSQYRANEALFERYMRVAFQSGSVRVFEAPRYPSVLGQVP